MRILFIAKKLDSASYIFYKNSFSKISQINANITFDFKSFSDNYDYKVFDFVFFMGGSIDSYRAKQINPKIKCIVVDSRSGHKDKLKNIDLYISNGFENYLYNLSDEYLNFIYPTYPQIEINLKDHNQKQKILIGYHGNKIHLETMYPRVTNALKKISIEKPIELLAMYNVKALGSSNIINTKKLGFNVKTVQYSYENYNKHLANCDIGLVPQLIPSKENILSRLITTNSYSRFNQSKDDYFLRFKDTTNLGRHFIFFQLGIPVISDITPSSISFIKNEQNGFLAYSSDNWYHYIKNLINNPNLRKSISFSAYQDWHKNYSHDTLNDKLINLLYKIHKNE